MTPRELQQDATRSRCEPRPERPLCAKRSSKRAWRSDEPGCSREQVRGARLIHSIGKGPPVARHLRNPHRAHDEEGREVASATIANVQQNGARGIIAHCACNHEALLPFTGLHI